MAGARRRGVRKSHPDIGAARRDERDYFRTEGRRLKATLRALLG